MKAAIFSTYATVSPHFETELEIAQQHLDAGDSIEFVSCWGELANCDFNPNRDAGRCQECRGRREAGLFLLDPHPPSRSFTNSNSDFKINQSLKLKFDSIEDLKNYRLEGFDIGYAALSSLVSLIRDPEPDLKKYESVLARYIQSASQAYQFTRAYTRHRSPDRIYVFNGRFAAMRAILRACQESGTDCKLHERGCDNQHFELFNNHLPHDINAIEAVIRRLWNEAEADLGSLSKRADIGKKWFVDRVNRVEKDWHSFTKKQETGRLPGDWNSNRKNVTIFCSSDDEFVAIGDAWQHTLYPNQVEAISRIAESMLDAKPSCRLYLRVHPNLTNVNNECKRKMMSLSFPNLTVIEPDAPVDSYALMKASDTVVSFGSSVGIEAVFWERPSVLLGPCFYRNLGGPYLPGSHAEAIQLLCTTLRPTDKTGALMYGYWFQTRGQKYKYYEPTGLFEGKFKGQLVYAGMRNLSRPNTLSQKLMREANRLVKQLSRTS